MNMSKKEALLRKADVAKVEAVAKPKKAKKNKINKEAETKLNETEVIVVLDRSASMRNIAQSTVVGFNSFLLEQRCAKGKGFLTLIQFADRDSYQITHKSVPLEDVQDLILYETYLPDGHATALRDAIGRTINDLKTDRDVVFVIITDGIENDSKEYSAEAIKNMITTLENEQKWKFVYMGANQDAVTIGQTYGVKQSNAVTYKADSEHVTMAFSSVGTNLSNMRSSKMDYLNTMQFNASVTYDAATLDTLEKDLSFNDEQREKLVK